MPQVAGGTPDPGPGPGADPGQGSGPGSGRVMFDADVASRSLGMELLAAGGGRAVVRMRVTAAMVNGHAIAHGGFVFLLADTAFACACNSYGPTTVASGAEITFVRPVYADDVLEAYAEERVRYGRSGVYDVTVRRGDEIVAEFRGRSRVIGQQAAPSTSGTSGTSGTSSA